MYINRLTDRQTDRQACWQAGRLEGWKAGRLAGWKAGRQADRGRQTDRQPVTIINFGALYRLANYYASL